MQNNQNPFGRNWLSALAVGGLFMTIIACGGGVGATVTGSTSGGTGTSGTTAGTGGLDAGGTGGGGFTSLVKVVGTSPTEAFVLKPVGNTLESQLVDISREGIPVTRFVRSSKSVSGDLWPHYYVTDHGSTTFIRFDASNTRVGFSAYVSNGHQPGIAIRPDGRRVIASHVRIASQNQVMIRLTDSSGTTLADTFFNVPTGYQFSRSGGGGSDARITPLRDGSVLLTLVNNAGDTVTHRYTWSGHTAVFDRKVLDTNTNGYRAGSIVELRDGTILMVERENGQFVQFDSSFNFVRLSAMSGFSSAGLQVAQNVFESGDEIIFVSGQQSPPSVPTTTAMIKAFKQEGATLVEVQKIEFRGSSVNDISVVQAPSSGGTTGGNSF